LTTFSDYDDLPKFLYTRQIIDETVRLYPAGWLMNRKALHDDQFGEYFVPAGTEIYVPPYFIQRHPDLWEEPDRFDPDLFRADNPKHRHRLATIPFSAGPEELRRGDFCPYRNADSSVDDCRVLAVAVRSIEADSARRRGEPVQ
jgi:hypothetical protein